MYFPNFYKSNTPSSSAQPDVEMGSTQAGSFKFPGLATKAKVAPQAPAQDSFAQATGDRAANAQREPESAAVAGPRRLFTKAMSRQTMIGGAIGLATGTLATAIYGAVATVQSKSNVMNNCYGQTHVGCAQGDLYSDGVMAGLMAGLPMVGAGIAAGIKALRFKKGVDDAETCAPVPADKEPFFNKRLAVKSAIAGSVGLVVAGIGVGGAIGGFREHLNVLAAACVADNGQYDQGTPCDGYSLAFPMGAVIGTAIGVPVAAVAIEWIRNALQRDYRKPEANG